MSKLLYRKIARSASIAANKKGDDITQEEGLGCAPSCVWEDVTLSECMAGDWMPMMSARKDSDLPSGA